MKEMILRKANEMFLSLGFKSVTMDDIAMEMGISKKTIYQHFNNKNELVEASTMHLFNTISGGVDDICSFGYNSIEEIFMIRKFIMKHLNNETKSPFFQLQKFFPETHNRLRAKQFEKMHCCMTESIRKGIKDGYYRADLNVDFISRIYFTGLTGVKDSDIFPSDVFDLNEITQEFLQYHVRGIATSKGLEMLDKVVKNN